MANLYSNDQIGLINMCLLSIGESPIPDTADVTTLGDGTDASIARDVVEKVSKNVQAQGWYFNTDYLATLTPDATENKIIIPDSVLRLDFSGTTARDSLTLIVADIDGVGTRGRVVWDIFKHTDIFTEEIRADVIVNVPYAELPMLCYEYIGARASRQFQQQVLGATDLSQNNLLLEQEAKTAFEREQLQYINRNMMSARISMRLANPGRFWRGA